MGWETIYENGGLEVFQKGIYPVDVFWAQVKEYYGVFNEFEGDAIKSFWKVYLKHKAW